MNSEKTEIFTPDKKEITRRKIISLLGPIFVGSVIYKYLEEDEFVRARHITCDFLEDNNFNINPEIHFNYLVNSIKLELKERQSELVDEPLTRYYIDDPYFEKTKKLILQQNGQGYEFLFAFVETLVDNRGNSIDFRTRGAFQINEAMAREFEIMFDLKEPNLTGEKPITKLDGEGQPMIIDNRDRLIPSLYVCIKMCKANYDAFNNRNITEEDMMLFLVSAYNNGSAVFDFKKKYSKGHNNLNFNNFLKYLQDLYNEQSWFSLSGMKKKLLIAMHISYIARFKAYFEYFNESRLMPIAKVSTATK